LEKCVTNRLAPAQPWPHQAKTLADSDLMARVNMKVEWSLDISKLVLEFGSGVAESFHWLLWNICGSSVFSLDKTHYKPLSPKFF